MKKKMKKKNEKTTKLDHEIEQQECVGNKIHRNNHECVSKRVDDKGGRQSTKNACCQAVDMM